MNGDGRGSDLLAWKVAEIFARFFVLPPSPCVNPWPLAPGPSFTAIDENSISISNGTSVYPKKKVSRVALFVTGGLGEGRSRAIGGRSVAHNAR